MFGQAERLRHTVQRVQQDGGSLMFWSGIMWGWHMPLVVMEGAETAIQYRNDILRTIVQPYRQNFREEFVLMDDNSLPHRAHLVNEFLHDNNIARLEWPACSPDMNPIDHAWHTSCFWTRWPTNHSERSTPNRHWGMGQSGPTEPWWTSGQYATTSTGMHQCKRTCYWELDVLVYAATWNTNSECRVALLSMCSNAYPLHYYALRVPRKADRWR